MQIEDFFKRRTLEVREFYQRNYAPLLKIKKCPDIDL